jgi:hypothetical protein
MQFISRKRRFRMSRHDLTRGSFMALTLLKHDHM